MGRKGKIRGQKMCLVVSSQRSRVCRELTRRNPWKLHVRIAIEVKKLRKNENSTSSRATRTGDFFYVFFFFRGSRQNVGKHHSIDPQDIFLLLFRLCVGVSLLRFKIPNNAHRPSSAHKIMADNFSGGFSSRGWHLARVRHEFAECEFNAFNYETNGLILPPVKTA